MFNCTMFLWNGNHAAGRSDIEICVLLIGPCQEQRYTSLRESKKFISLVALGGLIQVGVYSMSSVQKLHGTQEMVRTFDSNTTALRRKWLV